MTQESFNVEGLNLVGEFESRTLREARVAEDYENARRSGAVDAFTEVGIWAQEQILKAAPYDDTRALREIVSWAADKIREVSSPQATTGVKHA